MKNRHAVLLAAVLSLVPACGGRRSLPQDALDPEGPVARQLDRLWDLTFAIAVVIFFLVEGAILFIVFRYRARSDEDAPVQVHGNTKLELTWTIVPALLLAFVGFFTVGTVFDINRKDEGPDALNVKVIGHQWWWEYDYPDLDVVTANELHIPARRRVNLELTAADVIHSFWPPKLAGKLDVVPGRVNNMQIEADHAGTYLGQCAEYCGVSHANMRLRVVAHEPADFDAWVRNQRRPARSAEDLARLDPQAGEGAELFIQRGCNGCHTIDGLERATGKVGPNLTHLQSREVFAGAIFDLNERNLRKWLRDPPAEKPMMPDDGLGMPNLGLSEEDITKLIAYLKTLE